MRARHKGRGSVVLDRRRSVWYYLFSENGKRHTKLIGPTHKYRSKSAAWEAVETLRPAKPAVSASPNVNTLVDQYRAEKMPVRFSTKRGYEAWLRNHILPRWGSGPLQAMQPREVELWLGSLPLSAKSRAHIRGIMSVLWDFAMWRGDVEVSRNPMELVTVRGASRRARKPRSLTAEEFQQFVGNLAEPFRTMALVSVCCGLRISECLALKWFDLDWVRGKLRVERGIVRQHVDAVKTETSERGMSIGAELLSVFKSWKQRTEFTADDDWIFASPTKIGRLPWSYPQVLRVFTKAGEDAGIGRLSPHAMRHTYRAWLDAVGAPLSVQQKLMRHPDIRTTMNVYGDVVTDEMKQAGLRVEGLALSSNVIANYLQRPGTA